MRTPRSLPASLSWGWSSSLQPWRGHFRPLRGCDWQVRDPRVRVPGVGGCGVEPRMFDAPGAPRAGKFGGCGWGGWRKSLLCWGSRRAAVGRAVPGEGAFCRLTCFLPPGSAPGVFLPGTWSPAPPCRAG